MLPLLLAAVLAARAQATAEGEQPADAPPSDAPSAGTAGDAEPEDDASTFPGEEIIVVGDLEVKRRRAALDADLRRQGYRPGERKGDKVVYRPDIVWHPTVEVHDDGFVILKRTPVRFESYVDSKSNLKWLACIPPFGLMCIRPAGWLVSPARLSAEKGRVAVELDAELDAWQDAVVSQGFQKRAYQEVPALLDAVWRTGAPFRPGDPAMPTPEQRRAAILDFWASRADTPEGDGVREVVETFLDQEVQTSPWPATADEISAANAACLSQRRLAAP